jgi:hypothetical protein
MFLHFVRRLKNIRLKPPVSPVFGIELTNIFYVSVDCRPSLFSACILTDETLSTSFIEEYLESDFSIRAIEGSNDLALGVFVNGYWKFCLSL